MADTINEKNSVTLIGSSKADSIRNSGVKVRIETYAGNDTIRNYGNNSALIGGYDNDLLVNGEYWKNERGGKNVSINGGSGNDTITSHGSNSVLDGDEGNDLIYNGYRYYAPWDTFYDSDSNDYNGNNTTILGGKGNDTIKNRGHKVLISADIGNDSVDNYGDNVTIADGSNNDFLINGGYWENERGGKNVSISGGAGNDTITSHGSNSVLDGGEDNDLIYNGYRYYAPWDTFYDSDSNNYNGNNTTILGGKGNDTIKNRGHKVLISADTGNDSVDNYGDNVTINTGTGNDYIHSSGKNVLVKVDGGKNTVEGTVTVNLGKGNNTLTGDKNVQVYQYNGGNNFITNYSGEDIIQILSGKLDSYSFDGGDLIFHIGNGSLRLKNMTNHAITVKDSKGKTTTKIYSNGYSQQQVIKNFVKSMVGTILDSRDKLDEAIKLCSGFNSMKEVTDKMVADCRKANDADIFLRDYCGIILDNNDRDAVVGWDAGGLAMKTKSDLFPQTGDAVYPESTTFTIRGLTITVPEKDTLSKKEQLIVQGFYSWWAEEAIKLIEETFGFSFEGQSMKLTFFEDPTSFAWGLGSSGGVQVNLAYASFNADDKNGGGLGDNLFPHEMTHVLQDNFNIKSYMTNYMTEGMADLAAGHTRYMEALASDPALLAQYLDPDNTFNSDTNIYVAGYMFWRYLMKQASDSYDIMKGYAWKNGSSIIGTSKAELLTGSGKGVILSADAGNDTITAYGKKMKVFGDAGNDYILISSVASGAKIDGGKGNDSVENFGDSVTIDGGSNNDFLINGGYWENEKGGKNVSISGGAGNDTITNHGSKSVLDGGAGNDLIYNGYRYYAPWDTFYDSDSNDYNGNNATIFGGTGNDTIKNRGNNVVFNYTLNDGNDLIEGFNKTSTLGVSGGAYASIKSDNDIIVNVGKGNVTLKGAISLSKVRIKGKKATNLMVTDWTPSFVTVDFKIKTIDASTRTKAVKITGNKLANSIVGGSKNDSIYGGSGNDSLFGGKGNDSLWGDAGADKFIYAKGDGKDVIYGFDSKDTLTLDGIDFKTSYKNFVLTLKVDGGSVTLKDFTAKTFHINDDVYKISGSKFVKQK